jgi:hypothetical protein
VRGVEGRALNAQGGLELRLGSGMISHPTHCASSITVTCGQGLDLHRKMINSEQSLRIIAQESVTQP